MTREGRAWKSPKVFEENPNDLVDLRKNRGYLEKSGSLKTWSNPNYLRDWGKNLGYLEKLEIFGRNLKDLKTCVSLKYFRLGTQ